MTLKNPFKAMESFAVLVEKLKVLQDARLTNDYMPERFVDNRGGNIKPNSWDSDSENPTLFNVVYHFFYFWENSDHPQSLSKDETANLYVLIADKYITNGDKYMTNNFDYLVEGADSFSVDETIAVAAACNQFDFIGPLKKLRTWTSQTWYRFYDVVPFVLLCKYKWAHFLILPQLLVAISMIISSFTPKERTSGKQLDFVMALGLMDHYWMKFTWWICQKIVDYNHVFSIYYPEVDHPTRVLARKYFPIKGSK